MLVRLPAPLLITPADGVESDLPRDFLRVRDGSVAEQDQARSFGAVLARSRASRGLLKGPLDLFVAANRLSVPPSSPAGRTWVPHIFCWQATDRPSLAWELCDEDSLQERIGASAEDIARWASRPELLIRLTTMAAESASAVKFPAEGEHLSVRWLLAHQQQVAELLSVAVVAIEHVSLHVLADEEDRVVEAFTVALGMVEIPRPVSIAVPGRWLQAGACRVHLNSREPREAERGFPGTAPNHVCFAVADLESADEALRAAGFETRRAGSLGGQVWFRLSGGTAIELQRLRSRRGPSGAG